tara:strand:+ start:317 stop:505 length:189 start_codon:yes stop_codon:yes gene_type:complete
MNFDIKQILKDYLYVSKDVQQERLDICGNCKFLTKMNRCKKCGCFMNLKTWSSLAKCPEGKW